MLQKYQEVQLPSTPSYPVNNNTKAEILQMLSLKQCIYEYEGTQEQIEQPHQQQNNPSDKAPPPESSIAKKKNHRRIRSKNQSQTKFEAKQKSQSQRIFKKREAIEQSKKLILRGSVHNSTPKAKDTIFKNRFNSIQLHQKRQNSMMRKAIKAAETIAHAKTIERPGKQSESKHNNLEQRLKTFMSKYRSNYQFEKAKMKEVDLQHKRIEELVNQITNDREERSVESQKSQELHGSDKKTKELLIVDKKIPPMIKGKKEVVKGLLKQRYQIIQRIGRGLSGEVYKAKDILSDRFVAVKVSDSEKQDCEYEFYKKVQHRYIVNYLNNFTEKGKRFLILEYFPFTLDSLVRKRKISQQEVRNVFKCLASALMFLHSLGIAHRDIKMENIVCNEDLTIVKFIDFGLCVDIPQNNSQPSWQFCGTIGYMPPEILQKRSYDPKKADIWSLGILLYKLSFDRFPYRGKDERQMVLRITRTKLVFPEYCSDDLKHLLEKMICRNVEHRMKISQVIEHRWLL